MRERWDQIKEILGSALELKPETRLDYVRGACGVDEELRREIESLLSNHDGADSLLEHPPAPSVLAASSAMVGARVGDYRILRETGQGGMAVVYEAERADQEYRSRVAIKMVKPGGNPEEIIRRFRNERQTLAALDHPNIVRLVDGGTTQEGWPYLVMDFVQGVPVDQYCNRERLPICERLALFRSICTAVEYAHRAKVIHRDLKPGNILITPGGSPRLLDFGIAKLLDPEYAHTTIMTMADRRPMTPEYASPEQVSGREVTSASDIYSLGVLLYELLTGQRPHGTAPPSWPEMQRVVCEEEPPRPSTVATRSAQDAACRGTSPQELKRCLQGDLDTIVMMALRKEPQRRYASAEALSNDIGRHLSGMPVTARRSTITYRGGKFLQRHRESAIAVTIMVALTAGFTFWQNRGTSKAKAPGAAAARQSVAILGFKNLSGRPESSWLSTAVSEMLTTELAGGGKLRLISGETVARARIDLGLPEAESLAADTLGRLRKNLSGDYVVTGAFLEMGQGPGAAIRLDLRLQDTSKGETVAAVSQTGTEGDLIDLVAHSGAYLRQQLGVAEVPPAEAARIQAASSTNPEAMRFYAQGLAKLRVFDALAGRDLLARAVEADPGFALAHSALAQAWQTLGYDAKASQEARKAVDLADKLLREDQLLVKARFDESTLNWQHAIETYQSLFNVFPDTLEYGLALATAQTRAGRPRDALKTLAAMQESGTQARDDPRIDLCVSEAASALDDNRLRRDAAALAAGKAARAGAKLLVARARAQECRALANLGEYDKTQAVCEEGRRIYAEAGDRGGLARVLHSEAEVPLNQDDLPAAEQLYRQALELARAIGDKRGTGRELVNLALIFKKRGDYATAQRLNEESLRSYTEADDRANAALVTTNLGNLLHEQGKLPLALEYYQRSLASANAMGNKGTAALAMENIAETLAHQGDLASASRMFQQVQAGYQAAGMNSYYVSTLVTAGEVLALQGKTDEARKGFEEALARFEELHQPGGATDARLALAGL